MGAISLRHNRTALIDKAKCTECYTCLRAYVCPTDAIEETDLAWPRSIRKQFSSVIDVHKDTGVSGRGTYEMKTNDVTGRFRNAEAGFSVDIGRPGVGTTMKDVEKIAMEVAKLGVEFESQNPVTMLMADKNSGELRKDLMEEVVQSCVLEFKTEVARIPQVAETLKRVAERVDTVFCVGCIGRVLSDGSIPVRAELDRAGISYRPNGKVCVGLGRPEANSGEL